MGYASVPPGNAERRFRSRWKPVSLVYVELDGTNGGVVLNISDTGLALHAAQTVLQDSISKLRFKLPPSRQEIVACGRIAWKGDEQKKLGIRFLDLPESARFAIQQWIQADSVPRRLPEKVRPITLNRIRPAIEPLPASTEETPRPARGEDGRAGYPIAAAIAAAMRQAKEAGPAATPAASSTTGAPTLGAPPAPERIVRSEAIPKPAQAHASTATAKAQQSVVPAPRGAGASGTASAGQPLIRTMLVLDRQNQSAPERPQKVSSAWGRRMLFAAGLTLGSFFLGLAAGGRGLTESVRELSAAFARTWQAIVAKPAEDPAKTPEQRTEPKLGEAHAAPTVVPSMVQPETPPSSVEPPAKSVEPRVASDSRTVSGPAAVQTSGTAPKKSAAAAAHVRAASGGTAIPPGPAAASAATPVDPVGTRAASEESLPTVTTQDSGPAAPPAPVVEGTGGSVVVHSRLRSIRIPSELRLLLSSQGDGLQVGELISGDPPAYPAEALRNRVEGTVSLRAVIGRDGAIASAAVVKGPAVLAEPSLARVLGWRYEPTLLGGQAVEWEEDITVVFRLQDSSEVQK
jgi:TonB family protein